jgi:chemotaxis methyl-accepting protein methylase
MIVTQFSKNIVIPSTRFWREESAFLQLQTTADSSLPSE